MTHSTLNDAGLSPTEAIVRMKSSKTTSWARRNMYPTNEGSGERSSCCVEAEDVPGRSIWIGALSGKIRPSGTADNAEEITWWARSLKNQKRAMVES